MNEKVGKQSQNTQWKCGLKDSKYSSFSKHLSVKGSKQGLDRSERCSNNAKTLTKATLAAKMKPFLQTAILTLLHTFLKVQDLMNYYT